MNWTNTGIRVLFVIFALISWQYGVFSYIQTFVLGVADIAVDGDIPQSAIILMVDFALIILIGVVAPTLINRHRQPS